MIQKNSLVILGLGNTILTDDGVGIYVVREIQEKLNIYPTPTIPFRQKTGGQVQRGGTRPITIKEAALGGFNFIDLLTGFDRAVIIDAIHTKNGIPGEFYELDPAALKPSARLSNLHGIDFATACQMARDMKIPFPEEIRIFVMEVEDEFTFGEKCTEKVGAAIPKMAGFIVEKLQKEKWL